MKLFSHEFVDPSKEEVLSRIRYHSEMISDKTAIAKRIWASEPEVDSISYVYWPEGEKSTRLNFTDLALSQILNRIEIPVTFYRKNPPSLQRPLFNYWMSKKKGELLLRQVNTIVGTTTRAVLSTGYETIDDHQVFPEVIKALEDIGQEIQLKKFEYDDHITRLLIVFPDTQVRYQNTDIHAGILVTNSETGQSSVWIEPVAMFGSYSFLARKTLHQQKVDMRIVHRGNLKPEKIKDMVLRMKDIAQVGIVQLAEAWENRIDGQEAIKFLQTVECFPKRMADILKEEWEEIEDIARAEVAQRIMEMAKELPLFKRSLVEQSACSITGMFKSFESRMQKVLEEM